MLAGASWIICYVGWSLMRNEGGGSELVIFPAVFLFLLLESPTKKFQGGKVIFCLPSFIWLWQKVSVAWLVKLLKWKIFSFHVGEDINFSILQYADDSILIEDARWENLWSFKATHPSFELCQVWKRIFQWVLYLGRLPFKFLELPIGVNPRRCSSWELVVIFKEEASMFKGATSCTHWWQNYFN